MDTPRNYDDMVEQLVDAIAGAALHGVAIGLKQNTEAAIQGDYDVLCGTPAGPGGTPAAVPGLRDLWNAAQDVRTVKSAAYRTARVNGQVLARACINALKNVLGHEWNALWRAAGFLRSSLAVPYNPSPMLEQLGSYYEANPSRETPDVNGVDCTATACYAAADGINTAQAEYNQSLAEAVTARDAFYAGMNGCRNRIIGLRTELNQLLADDDARWLAFGFPMPASLGIPEVPENLTVTAGAPSSRTLIYNCDDAERADSYRFVLKDSEGTVLVDEIVFESEFVASDLPEGATVTAVVSGHNLDGDSQETEPVTAAVP